MEAIYPISALAKDQKAVKAAARNDLVRVTEHGAAAYIFCSEEVYERRIQEAVDQALYEARLGEAIARGRADVAAGRSIEGTDAVREVINWRISQNA